MPVNPIALAIPFFFLLIAVEWAVSRYQRIKVYRFNDAITDLSCGIGQQIAVIFLEGLVVTAYTLAYNSRLSFHFEQNSVWPWIIAFFGVDFLYYWWHRTSHRSNLVWATHVVHHQSQDFNLAVALRQAWFSILTSSVFYLPLALIGVPPLVFVTMQALSTLYQFWIHTETIGKLGAFELIFNSPSHHRVHHGVNPAYIDKNYAATLIIWDRLFGTYADETEPCVYGTVKPFESWNPIWANFEIFETLWRGCRQSRGFMSKLKYLLGPPERLADGSVFEIPQVARARFRKFETPMSRTTMIYVGVNFIIVTAFTTWIIFMKARLPRAILWPGCALILISVLAWGGLFENKRWVKPLEALRFAGILAFIVFLWRF